jgi:hypothetical protein
MEIRCEICGKYLYSLDEVDEEGYYCEDCSPPTQQPRNLGIFKLIDNCKKRLKDNAKKIEEETKDRPYTFTMPH